MVGPGLQEKRERLYDLEATDTYSPRKNDQDVNTRAFRLYWRMFLEREYCDPFEPEETRIKAEEEFLKFYRGDYPVLMNAIRTMFGQSEISFEDST